ncbi:hypothetical protein ScalyP_jg6559 [Parmales sp. scaly parma]|nr:hypothetical protein ScalyP_jg6559 [Parmales sp. scaly parma]
MDSPHQIDSAIFTFFNEDDEECLLDEAFIEMTKTTTEVSSVPYLDDDNKYLQSLSPVNRATIMRARRKQIIKQRRILSSTSSSSSASFYVSSVSSVSDTLHQNEDEAEVKSAPASTITFSSSSSSSSSPPPLPLAGGGDVKQRRLIRNRLSAQLHRERKAAALNDAQAMVASLTRDLNMERANGALFKSAIRELLKEDGENSCRNRGLLERKFAGLVESLGLGSQGGLEFGLGPGLDLDLDLELDLGLPSMVSSVSGSEGSSNCGSNYGSNCGSDNDEVEVVEVEVNANKKAKATATKKGMKRARSGGERVGKGTASAMAMGFGLLAFIGVMSTTTTPTLAPTTTTTTVNSIGRDLATIGEKGVVLFGNFNNDNVDELDESDQQPQLQNAHPTEIIEANSNPLWVVTGSSWELFDIRNQTSDVIFAPPRSSLRGSSSSSSRVPLPELKSDFAPSYLFAPQARATFSKDLLGLSVGRKESSSSSSSASASATVVSSESRALVAASATSAGTTGDNIPKMNGSDEDPLLYILVPTKSIWEGQEQGQEHEETVFEDSWMELSCKVLGARIVSQVDLV